MSQELFYRKLSKRLSYGLALSLFLNISLVAFGLYEWQSGGFSFLATSSFRPQKSKLYRVQGKDLSTLTTSFRDLEKQDFDSLVALVVDATPVAHGYKKGDVALSLLVQRHYFDLQRALGHQVAVRRLFQYMSSDGASCESILYPDLSEQELLSIKDFAAKEAWPLTAEGLLITYKETKDPRLLETFLMTDEYRCLEMLLCRGTKVSKDAVVDLCQTIDFKRIKNLYSEMVKGQDFSPEVRRGFLLDGLPTTCHILIQTDFRFCVQSLSDKQAVALLEGLSKQPEVAKEYALALLEGPRSNSVWSKAILLLCQQLELDPQTQNRRQLLVRFGRLAPEPVKVKTSQNIQVKPTDVKPIEVKPQQVKPLQVKPQQVKPQQVKPQQIKPPQAKPPQTKPTHAKPQQQKPPRELIYVVQSGDTLWHISKRFGVDVAKIKKYNKLTSDALKPGSTLRIPQDAKPLPPTTKK